MDTTESRIYSLLGVGDVKLLSPTPSPFSLKGVKLSMPPKLDQNFSAGVHASLFLVDLRIDPPSLSKLRGGEKSGDSLGVSCVMCFGSTPEQSKGVLLVLALTFEPEPICRTRTLQSSSIVRLVRADEADEHTVKGTVATVFLDDTDSEGVTRPKANSSPFPFFLFLHESKNRGGRFLF